MRASRIRPAMAALVAIAASSAFGQAPQPGPKQASVVLTSAEVALRDDSGASVPRRNPYERYRVEKAESGRLFVASPFDPKERGWVLTSEAIPEDTAEAYFSRKIRDRPDAYAYIMRLRDPARLRDDPEALATRIDDLTQAIRLDPGSWYAYQLRGFAWLRAADGPEAPASAAEKALADTDAALRLLKDDPATRRTLLRQRGIVARELGDLDGAIADWEQCRTPGRPDPLTLMLLTEAKADKGDLDGAIAMFTDALAAAGRKGLLPLEGRARLLLERGRLDEALADLAERDRVLPPRFRQGTLRARIRAARGEYAAALADFEESTRFAPGARVAPTALAPFVFFLATCPDPKYRDGPRALKLADEASRMPGPPLNKPQHAEMLDARAAALAELGRFDEAAKVEEQALALLLKKSRQRPDFEQRLALYRDRKPYRDAPR